MRGIATGCSLRCLTQGLWRSNVEGVRERCAHHSSMHSRPGREPSALGTCCERPPTQTPSTTMSLRAEANALLPFVMLSHSEPSTSVGRWCKLKAGNKAPLILISIHGALEEVSLSLQDMGTITASGTRPRRSWRSPWQWSCAMQSVWRIPARMRSAVRCAQAASWGTRFT